MDCHRVAVNYNKLNSVFSNGLAVTLIYLSNCSALREVKHTQVAFFVPLRVIHSGSNVWSPVWWRCYIDTCTAERTASLPIVANLGSLCRPVLLRSETLWLCVFSKYAELLSNLTCFLASVINSFYHDLVFYVVFVCLFLCFFVCFFVCCWVFFKVTICS